MKFDYLYILRFLWSWPYSKQTRKILAVLQCHWHPWHITSVQTWKDCSSLSPTPFLCTYHQTSSNGLNSRPRIFSIKTMIFMKGEHHLLASKYRLEKRFMLYKILLQFLSNAILTKMLCSVNTENTPFAGLTEQKKYPKYLFPAGGKMDTSHKLFIKS